MNKLHIDILRAIALYQEEHNDQGMPEERHDILKFYIDKVNRLNWWPKEPKK